MCRCVCVRVRGQVWPSLLQVSKCLQYSVTQFPVFHGLLDIVLSFYARCTVAVCARFAIVTVLTASGT